MSGVIIIFFIVIIIALFVRLTYEITSNNSQMKDSRETETYGCVS